LPKEITHWLSALQMAGDLGDHASGRAAACCPNALKLGAVFPDALFYSYRIGSSKEDPYRRLAHQYHGSCGGDSYQLIRQLAAALPASPYPLPLLAFLAGVVSHIQTDVAFHPFVYYMSGNYEDPDPLRRTRAVRCHRRFECLMDLYFCDGPENLGQYSLRDILLNLEFPLPYLFGIVSSPDPPHDRVPGLAPAMEGALGRFQRLQGLCRHRPLARFLDRIAPSLPLTAQEIFALFYSPRLDQHLPRIAGGLPYRHPISGEAGTAHLSDMLQKAVLNGGDLMRRIERESQVQQVPVLPEPGPSLSYGQMGGLAGKPRYFAEKPFLD